MIIIKYKLIKINKLNTTVIHKRKKKKKKKVNYYYLTNQNLVL